MPTFTQDWFTHRIPVFTQLLEPLAGRPCAALEIGTFEGRCAVWLLEHTLTHPQSYLVCVDPLFSHYKETLLDNLRPYLAKVRVIEAVSAMALSQLVAAAALFDFVYIDGQHQGHMPLHDLVLSHELIKRGGIIAIDDYRLVDDTCGPVTVMRCTDAFLQCYGSHYEVIHHGYQVWLRRK